jgi:hypothetical protein
MSKAHAWSPAYYGAFNSDAAVIAYAANEEKMRAIASRRQTLT